MRPKDIRRGFRKRKPWTTKFVIDGNEYGGWYYAGEDLRVDQFFQQFPDVKTILELGSLEGGHTFALAGRPGVERVLGIEGRQKSVDNARFVQELLGIKNAEFLRKNLDGADLSAFGRFDAVFCVGLLYHLPEPWKLVLQMSKVSPNCFVWTHYADEGRADKVVEGYRGTTYQEGGLRDPLSGMSPESFWPTLESLNTMLLKNGYEAVQHIDNNPDHPNGPCITLAATGQEA